MIGFGLGPGGSGAGNLLRVKKDLRMTRPSRPTMALTSRDMIQWSGGVLFLIETAKLGPLDGDALISIRRNASASLSLHDILHFICCGVKRGSCIHLCSSFQPY